MVHRGAMSAIYAADYIAMNAERMVFVPTACLKKEYKSMINAKTLQREIEKVIRLGDQDQAEKIMEYLNITKRLNYQGSLNAVATMGFDSQLFREILEGA